MTGSNRPSIQTHAQLIHSIRGWQDVPRVQVTTWINYGPTRKDNVWRPLLPLICLLRTPRDPYFIQMDSRTFYWKSVPVEEPPALQSVAPQSPLEPHLHSEACAQLCWLRFLQHQQHQNHTLAIKQEPVDRPDSRLVLWVLICRWWFTGVVRTSMTPTNSFACELSSAYSRT